MHRRLPPHRLRERLILSIRAYIYLVIATLCWGANAVAGKIAIGHISPMLLTAARWFFAFVLIVVISLPQLRRDWPEIRRHWPLLTFLGVIGYTAFNAFLYNAVLYTTAINVAIEQAGIPALIFLGNFLLFRMRVSLAQIAGFSLALLGVALTATHGKPLQIIALDLNFGDALMLVAIAAYAAYTILLRWRPAIHWKSMMALSALGAFVSAIPLAGWEIAAGAAIWPDTEGWVIALWTSVFASLLAQTLYILGVAGIGPNRAGLFINLVPVFGTLLSVLVVGEPLQLFHVAALALALGGIAIAEIGRPKA